MRSKLSQVNKQYEDACNEYINLFVRKQGYEHTGWISDEVGSVAEFIEQYFFNIDDIIYDLNSKQPKGLIFQWQDDYVEHAFDEEGTERSLVEINYRAYCKGMRFDMLKSDN